MADTNDMKHTEIEDNKPDIKLVRALQKDFNALYVSQFTTAWKENRLIRNMELGIMSLDNLEAYINSQLRATLERLKDKSKSYTVDVLRSDDYEVKEWAIPLSAIDEELSKLEEK